MTPLRTIQWLTIVGLVAAAIWGVSRNPEQKSHRRTIQHETNPVQTHSLHSQSVTNLSTTAASNATLNRFSKLTALLESGTDTVARENKIQVMLARINPEDIRAWVTDSFSQTNSQFGNSLQSRLIRRWAEINPQSAADWIAALPPGVARQQAIDNLAIAWANTNLTEAIAWAQKLTDETERQSGLITIANEAARTEPITALELASKLPDSTPRNELVRHAASQWAATDPTTAATWAKDIGDTSLRDTVTSSIASVWAAADPVAAASLAVNSISPGREQNDAVVSIIQRWVQKDAEAAASWVEQFPDDVLRNHAVEALVQLWTNRDAQRAGQWVDALPVSPGRDAALTVYVSQVAVRTPSLAATWAEKIQDQQQREQALETVAANWLALDATAARVWISQAALPAATKAALLKP